MERREFIKTAVVQSVGLSLVPFAWSAGAANSPGTDQLPEFMPEMIAFPENPEEWESFRSSLNEWRTDIRRKIKYDGALYDRPEFRWVSSAYKCYFLMMYDQIFYDRKKQEYILDQFLHETQAKFGRIDIVVLWHAYPRIGLDDRNQFDFYRDMPGGLSGLRKIAAQLHEKNCKVFVNYNPWDTGTRRENLTDADALVELVKEIGVDGIFLDTMAGGADLLREKLDAATPGVVLESELALAAEGIHNHHMSWAQWFPDGNVPGVLRNKWIERRHMQHGISRWQRDRSKELHTAWMNGSGIMIWENVFGQWVGWNERDASVLRLMSAIQQRYSSLFSGEGWIPLSEKALTPDIFISSWKDEGLRLWTLINRSEREVEGPLFEIDLKAGYRYFDLISGEELKMSGDSDRKAITGRINPRSIGCFLEIAGKLADKDLKRFLAEQKAGFKRLSIDTEFPEIKAEPAPFSRAFMPIDTASGMIKIPAFSGEMEVTFRNREVGFYDSVDVSYINIGAPALHQLKTIRRKAGFPAFLIDETPVTNAQFEEFLKDSGYVPKEKTNFLKHWDNGQIPAGRAQHPVVYVDLDDARAYAKWAGRRLPAELEWQFAAQGPNGKKYPWGSEFLKDRCNAGDEGTTTPVNAFPEGKSEFGCWDMCGNVWEITESEYNDGRNRFCMLKGGSFYRAKGSDWYFDGGPQAADFSAKQLLLYPGIDRCATVGFRCAADIKNS